MNLIRIKLANQILAKLKEHGFSITGVKPQGFFTHQIAIQFQARPGEMNFEQVLEKLKEISKINEKHKGEASFTINLPNTYDKKLSGSIMIESELNKPRFTDDQLKVIEGLKSWTVKSLVDEPSGERKIELRRPSIRLVKKPPGKTE